MITRVGLFLLSSMVTLQAFSGLTLAPDSVKLGENVLLSGAFGSAGDTAVAEIWIDRDGDGVLGEADIMLFGGKDEAMIVDGASPEDSVVDGKFSMTFPTGGEGGPFPFASTFFMVLTDNGGSDTSKMIVSPAEQTGPSISVQVKGADGSVVVDHGVKLMIPLDSMWQQRYAVTVLTDSQGVAKLYFPDSLVGRFCLVKVDDMLHIMGDTLLPPQEIDTTISEGLKLTMNYITAPYHIAAHFATPNGTPIVGERLMASMGDKQRFLERETDLNGNVTFPVVTGTWYISPENWPSQKWIIADTLYTVTATDLSVDIVGYAVDSSITVILNGAEGTLSPKEFGLSASAKDSKGKPYAVHVSDSPDMTFTRIIPVSTKLLGWSVDAWINGMQSGYIIAPSHVDSVAPGDTVVMELKKVIIPLVGRVTLPDSTTGISNTTVYLFGGSGEPQSIVTDAEGYFAMDVYPGSWDLRVMDSGYLGQQNYLQLPYNATDTVRVHLLAMVADTVITGVVTSDNSALLPEVVIRAHLFSDGGKYESATGVNNDGSYSLPVAKSGNGYFVILERQKLSVGYFVTPLEGKEYPYSFVKPGFDSADFSIIQADGMVKGKLALEISGPSIVEFHIGAGDSTLTSVYPALINFQDQSYRIDLPQGTYTIAGIIVRENKGVRDTAFIRVDKVVVGADPVNLDITSNMVPTVAVKSVAHFGIASITQVGGVLQVLCSVPDRNIHLDLYDLRGRVVGSINEMVPNFGAQSVTMPVNTLASGCYILRLNSGKVVQTSRIILK